MESPPGVGTGAAPRGREFLRERGWRNQGLHRIQPPPGTIPSMGLWGSLAMQGEAGGA